MPYHQLPQEQLETNESAHAVTTSLDSATSNRTVDAIQEVSEHSEDEEIKIWLDEVGQGRSQRWDAQSLLIAVLCVLPPLKMLQQYLEYWQYSGDWIWLLTAGGSVSIPLLLLNKIHTLQTRQQEDLALGPMQKRWIGPLVEALSAPTPRVRAAASRALTRLLPRIRSADAYLFTPRVCAQLYTVRTYAVDAML